VGSNPATPTPANRRSGALIAGLLFCFVGQIGPYNCGVQQCVSTIEARPNRLSASRVTVQDDAAESGDEAASCWQAVFRCFVPSSASCRRVLRAVERFEVDPTPTWNAQHGHNSAEQSPDTCRAGTPC
jgi:hypothetical protein